MNILRKLRKERGLTLEDISEAVGVTKSYISQIERGLKAPSLEILRSLADYLQISPGVLLNPPCDGAQPGGCVVVAKEQRYRVDLATADSSVLVETLLPNAQFTGMSAYIATVPANGWVSGKQVTHLCCEFVYILSGAFEGFIGDKTYRLEAETTAYIAPMIPHDYHNISGQSAKVMFFCKE